MSEPDTAETPVATGAIPADGVVSLLGELEALRATGVLAFEAEGESWQVALVAGQIATEQPERDDGQDAVEKLLEQREGTYRVYQRLPPLPVSSGGPTHREGSLAVHVPADLMNYCERAGLTGRLLFEFADDRAEVIYEGGELSTIRLDGVEDLNDVFSWEDGTFRIEAQLPSDADTPDESADEPEKPKSEPPLLSVVEVALASIVREREERRPGSRTGPLLPPMPAPRDPETLPPPARKTRPSRRDATVRVIYLGGGGRKTAPMDRSTRHVRDDVTGEIILPEATRGKRDAKTPSTNPTGPAEEAPKGGEAMTDADAAADAAATTPDAMLHVNQPEDDFALGKTAAWTVGVVLLIIVALGVLAHLPALE